MEEFLPSEIARAVYGYLLSEGCEAAAKAFLGTSPHMSECKQLVQRGKRVTHTNTLLLGRNLTEILNIACNVHTLVRQAQDKRQQNRSDDRPNLTVLFDQLRSFVLTEPVTNQSGGGNNTAGDLWHNVVGDATHQDSHNEEDHFPSQTESQNSNPSQQVSCAPARVDFTKKSSLAENYKNLVQECSEGLDLSPSPEKATSKNKVSGHQEMRPTSAPRAIVFPELDMENQSAITAIAGMSFATTHTPQVITVPTSSHVSSIVNTHQMIGPRPVVHHNLPPVVHMTQAGSAVPADAQARLNTNSTSLSCSVSTFTSCSAPQPVSAVSTVPHSAVSTLVTCSSQPIPAPTDGHNYNNIDRLPDPPIIVLGNQNRPFDTTADPSSSYFNLPPCAASTPHDPVPVMFAPEDTACIIYPPLKTDCIPKMGRPQKKILEKNLRRRMRRLLPKPLRKDPPNILHIKVLPQPSEEEEEDADDPLAIDGEDNENNYGELAKELPNLDDDEEELDGRIYIKEVETKTIENVKESKPQEEQNEINKNAEDKNSVVGENSTEEIAKENTEENSTEPANSESNIKSSKNKEINTPKPPPLKKNISRSTPRRNSHIRALNFNTPLKPIVNRKANTSPKMPRIKFSPRSSKLHRVKRSSLFKSPSSPKKSNVPMLSRLSENDEEDVVDETQETNIEEDESNQGSEEEHSVSKIPIATRSPAPKLSSVWKEVNDITITEKPIWDEKIRSFISGDFVDPVPPPKKDAKGKPKGKARVQPRQTKKESIENSKVKAQLPRRSSRLSRNSKTPVKSPTSKVSGKCESEKTPRKEMSNSPSSGSSKVIIKNKTKKTPIKKTVKKIKAMEITEDEEESLTTNESTGKSNLTHDTSNENKSSDSPNKTTDNHLNSEDNNGNELGVKGDNINVPDVTNNILLEDLVVSSNSCFPQTVDEIGNEINKSFNESAPISNESIQNEVRSGPADSQTLKIKESKIIESGSSFALPRMPELETPMKEIIVQQTTCILNTPLMKTIRVDTSVLEEDLLLTPSLPPTPQVNLQSQLVRTPYKPPEKVLVECDKPPSITPENKAVKFEDKQSNIHKANRYSSTESSDSEVCDINKSKDHSKSPLVAGRVAQKNEKRELINARESYTDSSESEVFDVCKSSTVQSIKPTESKNKSLNNMKRIIVDSSTDSDEYQNMINNYNKIQSSQLKEYPRIRTRIVPKCNSMSSVTQKKVKSTTESEDEINVAHCDTGKSIPSKINLPKIDNLINSEIKKITNKPKKDEISKKRKLAAKKLSPKTVIPLSNPSGDNSSLNSSQEIKKTPKKKKQNVKETCAKAKGSSNELLETKTRQELQLELLRRERQVIFGDGFTSSSDSEEVTKIFENKKFPSKRSKRDKLILKKRKSIEHIIISDESSIDIALKDVDKEKSGKIVRFETKIDVKSLKAGNSKERVALGDSKEKHLMVGKSTESCIETNVEKSIESILIVENTIEKPNEKVTEERNDKIVKGAKSITTIASENNSSVTVDSSVDPCTNCEKNLSDAVESALDKDGPKDYNDSTENAGPLDEHNNLKKGNLLVEINSLNTVENSVNGGENYGKNKSGEVEIPVDKNSVHNIDSTDITEPLDKDNHSKHGNLLDERNRLNTIDSTVEGCNNYGKNKLDEVRISVDKNTVNNIDFTEITPLNKDNNLIHCNLLVERNSLSKVDNSVDGCETYEKNKLNDIASCVNEDHLVGNNNLTEINEPLVIDNYLPEGNLLFGRKNSSSVGGCQNSEKNKSDEVQIPDSKNAPVDNIDSTGITEPLDKENHSKHGNLSVERNSCPNVSSSTDGNYSSGSKEDSEIDSIPEKNSERPQMEVPRPPTPFRIGSNGENNVSASVEDLAHLDENFTPEEHVYVFSSNTSPKFSNSLCNEIDLAYSVQCQDEEGMYSITYSDYIVHHAARNDDEYQNDSDHLKIDAVQESLSGENSEQSRGTPGGKRRIKLTPIGSDKYEQKLKVDYDVIDGKVINKRKDRLIGDPDCSSSTIDTPSKRDVKSKKEKICTKTVSSKQLFKDKGNSRERTRDSETSVEGSDTTKEIIKEFSNNISGKSSKGSSMQNSVETLEKEASEQRKLKRCDTNLDSKILSEKEGKYKIKGIETDKRHSNGDGASEEEKTKSRTQLDRRKDQERSHRRRDSPSRRSFNRADYDRKRSERKSGGYDRRGYSERRHRTSPIADSKHEDSPSKERRSPKNQQRPTTKQHRSPIPSPHSDPYKQMKSPNKQRRSPSMSPPLSDPFKQMKSPNKQRRSPSMSPPLSDPYKQMKSPNKQRSSPSMSPPLSDSYNQMKSPNKQRRSPIKQRRSPYEQRKSPIKHRRSPTKHRRSPIKHRRSPMKHRRSPIKHRRSPPRYHRSPIKRRRSPHHHRYTSKYYDEYKSSRYNSKFVSARSHDERSSRKHIDKDKSLSIRYNDPDNVDEDERKNSRFEDFEVPESLDPRAANVLTYSDTEKNDSCSGEACSLMDFAVMEKVKNKRLLTDTPRSSTTTAQVEKPHPPQTSKRKVPANEEPSMESSQSSKKLKLEEVDMKEAKSVLKHKMVDMLNVLHPDTSNEAT